MYAPHLHKLTRQNGRYDCDDDDNAIAGNTARKTQQRTFRVCFGRVIKLQPREASHIAYANWNATTTTMSFHKSADPGNISGEKCQAFVMSTARKSVHSWVKIGECVYVGGGGVVGVVCGSYTLTFRLSNVIRAMALRCFCYLGNFISGVIIWAL